MDQKTRKEDENEDGFPIEEDKNPIKKTKEKKMNSLLMIQSELKAPKSHTNKFGNYKYRNCDDILEAVKPLLLKYEATMYITDDVKVIGNFVYVVATVLFKDKHGTATQSKAFAREPESKAGMSSEQVTGSASSYARKYALGGLFLIDDGKDADSDDNTEEPTKHGNEKQDPSNKLTKEIIPEFLRKWNGKLYGKSVFFNNEKYLLDEKQIEWIKTQPQYKPDKQK